MLISCYDIYKLINKHKTTKRHSEEEKNMKTTAKQEMMNVVERYAKKNGEVYEVSK